MVQVGLGIWAFSIVMVLVYIVRHILSENSIKIRILTNSMTIVFILLIVYINSITQATGVMGILTYIVLGYGMLISYIVVVSRAWV